MISFSIPRRSRSATAVTIGNFDGFHLGHRRVVDELLAVSRRSGCRSVILTFFPHPRIQLGHDIALIFSDAQRKEFLRRQAVDRLLLLDFPAVQGIPPDRFVEEILVDRLRLQTLVFSGDFLFGSGRGGTVALLRDYARRCGFALCEVAPVEIDGERVSSSAIRKKLQRGEVAAAGRMLGRPYEIAGIVVRGDGRGRQLGFPTLNMDTENRILPPGVFYTIVEIGSRRYPSVTNIGLRPTFCAGEAGHEPLVETHIPGFGRSLYGRRLRLAFVEKIRDERRFDSAAALRRQIAADVAAALLLSAP